MSVNASAPRLARAILLALFGTAFAAPAFAANTNPWDGDVHPSFAFYGWLPGVSLDTRIKVPAIGGGSATVQNRSDGNIYDNLSGAFMMAGDIRVGDWGFFGDFAWVKFDDQDGHFRAFDGQHIDANLSTRWNLKGGVVTLAGLYTLAHGSFGYTDVVFGGRYLWIKTNYKWDFNATGGGGIIDIADSGHVAKNRNSSDAIIGLRGNWVIGQSGRWYIPYYIDVGAGQSDWTTAANLGIGYLYDWGNIGFVWRDLRYKQGNDKFLRKFALDGPSFNIGWQF
ncbi:MAG TPA: hypothetical protein VFL30_12685 [Rhodanobacteraceae bacterium]|nr:hypothetical protein [Rhodanobacteraceae bacterium]